MKLVYVDNSVNDTVLEPCHWRYSWAMVKAQKANNYYKNDIFSIRSNTQVCNCVKHKLREE